MTITEKDEKWLDDQIKQFIKLGNRLKKFEQVLNIILKKAIKKSAPQSMLQTRVKSLSSFAEKAMRKRHKYRNSVKKMTDLLGGRIIVVTLSQLETISDYINNHFEIDWKNSVDVSERLKLTEFGYRSVHYVISIPKNKKKQKNLIKELGFDIPEEIFNLKAEIQVRTALQHSWADFQYYLSYKGAFKIPDKWVRDIAAKAARLEDIDNDFIRIYDGLKEYASTYGKYMTEEELQNEISM